MEMVNRIMRDYTYAREAGKSRINRRKKLWSVYMAVEHQGFCVLRNVTANRKEIAWYRRQLAIALARLVKKETVETRKKERTLSHEKDA